MAISCIILAGGRATRMNGVDKGLVILNHQPLIAHVIARLSPQVDEILINANREILQYQRFGYPVLQDLTSDFIGPLAGFQIGLTNAKHDYLLTVPCDCPQLPSNLAQRLFDALISNNAAIAVAKSAGNNHPVVSLCKKEMLPSLTRYINDGGRKVSAWQQSLKYIEVDFTNLDDSQNEPFTNVNTLDDIARLETSIKLTYANLTHA